MVLECCCCCAKEVSQEEDVPFGKDMKRSCRDVFWLILFILFSSGMIVVAVFAFIEGDTNRFTHGTDMYGAMCGLNNSLTTSNFTAIYDNTNKPVLLWPTPLNLSIQICVEACPNTTIDFLDIFLIFLPFETSIFGNRSKALSKLICTYGVSPSLEAVLNGSCFPTYASSATLGRCIPDFGVNSSEIMDSILSAFFGNVSETIIQLSSSEEIDNETSLSASLSQLQDTNVNIFALAEQLISEINAREVFTRVISDIASSWKLILILGASAFLVGFAWLIFIRLFAGIVVWTVILGVLIGLFGLTIFVWVKSKEALYSLPSTETLTIEDDVIMAEFLSYATNALLILDTVVVCLLAFFRRRIKLAVAIVKEASIAVKNLPSLVTIVPLFTFLALSIFITYWIVVLLFLATAGMKTELTVKQFFDYYLPNYTLQYLAIYHGFGLFWITAFILAMTRLTIAGSIAAFYWKKGDPGKCASVWSFGRALRYHAGSAALGSLIISIVRFLRALLECEREFSFFFLHTSHYQFQTDGNARKKRKQQKLPKGATLGAAFCCLNCCLCCFEGCLKFLSNNAYIVVAITGKSLCSAGRQAVLTLAKNPIRTVTTNVIAGFFFILTKLAIASITAFIAALVLHNDSDLKYWYIPVALVFMIAYVISSIFTVIYEMSVKVILFSFCFDEQILGEAHDIRLVEFMSKDKRKANDDIEQQQQQQQRLQEEKEAPKSESM